MKKKLTLILNAPSAAHCKQTKRKQFIELGLMRVTIY